MNDLTEGLINFVNHYLMTCHSPPTVLFKLYTLMFVLLIASSKLTSEPLILDVKFCIYALVARVLFICNGKCYALLLQLKNECANMVVTLYMAN